MYTITVLLHDTMSSVPETEIPIIDIGNLYSQNQVTESDSKTVKIAQEFGNALHECGFAYLVNHGIPENIEVLQMHTSKADIESAFCQSKCFFDLPTEVKSKYRKADVVKNYHGYNQIGVEKFDKKFSQELRESYDIFGNIRHYPEIEVPLFQESIESFETVCRSLDTKLLKLLSISLKLEDINFFNNVCRNLEDRSIPCLSTCRTLYYPPIEADVDEGAVRCSEHTDYDIITLLFQDSVGGLQVKTAQNQWIEAKHIPNSIVINTGDSLETWTGGYFPATPHRILVPDTQHQRQNCRQSIAFFLHADNNVIISPVSLGVSWKSPNTFAPISALDYCMNKMKMAFGKY